MTLKLFEALIFMNSIYFQIMRWDIGQFWDESKKNRQTRFGENAEKAGVSH
jgi:hypothetical protein